MMKYTDFFKDRSPKGPRPDPIRGVRMNAPLFREGGRRGSVPPGDIGIEIELEGTGLIGTASLEKVVSKELGATWLVKREGSLRGGGLEYVLSQPVKLAELDDMVEAFYGTLVKANTVVEVSNRTSTHVHINVGHLKVNQITSIIAVWTAFEEAIIDIFGENRKTNHFCLSAKDSETLLQRWRGFLETGEAVGNEGAKYCALNVRPIWTFGSLEFRCAPVWDDSSDLIEWCKFLAALRDFSVTNYPNPANILLQFSENGGASVFSAICAAAGTREFYDKVVKTAGGVDKFNVMALEGIRRVQDVLYNFPWEGWLEHYISSELAPDPFEKPAKKSATIEFQGWATVATAPLQATTRSTPLRDAGWVLDRPLPAFEPEVGEDFPEAEEDDEL